MTTETFTWIPTHKAIAEYLLTQEDNQKGLIELLKSTGINSFSDKDEAGNMSDLEEIDPFTFFCYIYKHGAVKNLSILQAIAQKISAPIPNDVAGMPSTNAQSVWMFPYKADRQNNEIERLWEFFKSVLSDAITDEQFNDVLRIRGIGKTKLTEALFTIAPEKYLPINGPTKPLLKSTFLVDTEFSTLSDYLKILSDIREKTDKAFYEISYDAWKIGRAGVVAEPNPSYKRKYWLYSPGRKALFWDEFYEKGIMALGWDALGDLSQYSSKAEIQNKLQEIDGTEKPATNNAMANDEFKNEMSIGDIIIAKKGLKEYLGYGIVKSDVYHDNNRQTYRNCRKVEWRKRGVWPAEDGTIVLKTLTDITKYPEYVKKLIALIGIDTEAPIPASVPETIFPLNTIFYGPPGTGKTYTTVQRAAEIIAGQLIDNYSEAKRIFKENLHDRIEFITFHQNYSYEDFIQGLRPDTENDKELTFERKDGVFKIIADKALKNLRESEQHQTAKRPFEELFNQFVQPLIEGEKEEIEVKMKKASYFITGISNKSIEFRKPSGGTAHTLSIATVRKMYDSESYFAVQGLSPYYNPLIENLITLGKNKGSNNPLVLKQNYVIVIDEINRANISRVFGELITLIEPDKRSHGDIPMEARLPSGDIFIVPSNLYIIGTMNTADKSIALLDIALRRRFDFEAMYPQYQIEGREIYDAELLKKLNQEIVLRKGYDFQIGHAYFMGENKDLIQRMNKKVIPLLSEYFMNDEKEIKEILGACDLKIKEGAWPLQITA